jgi:hypothetical protein
MKQRFAIETDIAAGRMRDRPFTGADFLLRRGQLSQHRLKRAERAQRSQLEKAAKATDELGYESLRAGSAAKPQVVMIYIRRPGRRRAQKEGAPKASY